MIENASSAAIDDSVAVTFPNALKTIIAGGLTVGVLDCLAATINSARKGVTFTQVWQYVASGLLGKDSYTYGWKSVALGLFVHFFIAFSVTTVFYFASRRLPILVRQAVLFGVIYGIAVYFVMGYIVSPLSRTARLPFSIESMLIGIFIHIVCIGLPVALVVRYFTKKAGEFE